MYTEIRGRAKRTYNEVVNILEFTKSIFESNCIPSSLFRKIYITEKVGVKFAKPSAPMDRALYLFIGGWRLIGQDRGKAEINSPMMYNYELGVDSVTVMAPASNSLYVIKSPEGIDVAEVIDDHIINILFDICDHRINNKKEILECIYQDIFKHFYGLDIDRLKEDKIKAATGAVSDFLIGLAEQGVKQASDNFRKEEEEIRALQERMDEVVARRQEALVILEGYRSQTEGAAKKLEKEIEDMNNIDAVEYVEIDGTGKRLVIHTNDIYITHARKRYYIGRFALYVSPSSGSVKFENKNNPRRGTWGDRCQHPHVSTSGQACWGNAQTAVSVYIKNNEYQALASLLIGFLESVNTADIAGKYITSWDVVNKSGEVIQQGYHYNNPPANSETFVCVECEDTYRREDISMNRHDTQVCKHCADKYFVCGVCEDIHKKEDGVLCDTCNEILICDDCIEDQDVCSLCKEKERVQEQLDAGMNLCPFCKTLISDDELMTCETCGVQGCGTCITYDGAYACPDHQ